MVQLGAVLALIFVGRDALDRRRRGAVHAARPATGICRTHRLASTDRHDVAALVLRTQHHDLLLLLSRKYPDQIKCTPKQTFMAPACHRFLETDLDYINVVFAVV